MSRPKLSVPNQCARSGRSSRSTGRISCGSPVHQSGASTAVSTSRASATSPPTNVGWRATTRRALATRPARGGTASNAYSVADAGIEEDIEDVHGEVDQHVYDRDDQDHALDHRIVATDDRVDGQAAEPRQREDALGD